MPRRYSEEPVNLLQILPSQEKARRLNPLQPSVTRVALEATAAGVRGLADIVTRAAKRARFAVTDMARSTQEYRQQVYRLVGWMILQSRRLRQNLQRVIATIVQRAAKRWDKVLDRTKQALTRKHTSARSKPVKMARHESGDDVATLRAQLLAQQQELAQVTSQMMELKALAMSQEQVLLYLGKELDTMHMPVVPAQAIASKKPANRAKKSVKPKRVAPSQVQAEQKPSVSL